jgi:hypothetical protein
MTEEIWKPVFGYENIYEVSNLGNVRTIEHYTKHGRSKMKVLGKLLKKQCDKQNRYLYVSLCKNGKRQKCSVHRLVAQAFIPNPENKRCVDHIDGSRDNNCEYNLRWCSHKENMNFPIAKERLSISHKGIIPTEETKRKRYQTWVKNGKPLHRPLNNKKSKAVEQVDMEGSVVSVFPSMKEVERKLGYSASRICDCCKGKQKTSYGYRWRYKTNIVKLNKNK